MSARNASPGNRCSHCYGDVRGECIRVGGCIFAVHTRPHLRAALTDGVGLLVVAVIFVLAILA